MDRLLKTFIEMASYLEIAKFDDTDEWQGAQEVLTMFMINASDHEKQLLLDYIRKVLSDTDAPIDRRFYEQFRDRLDYYLKEWGEDSED